MSLSAEQVAEYSTPQEHVSAIKNLAKKIESNEYISSCIVDDWGRFSNFQVIVEVTDEVFATANKGILTRKINAVFDNLLKETGAHRRETFSPEAYRKWCPYEKKMKTTGYDRDFWMVDIDFNHFNAETNSFDS